MGASADVIANVNTFQSALKTKIESIETTLDFMASQDYAKLQYQNLFQSGDAMVSTATSTLTDAKQDSFVSDSYTSNILTHKPMGDIGTITLSDLTKPVMSDNTRFLSEIIPASDKNLDAYTFTPIDTYLGKTGTPDDVTSLNSVGTDIVDKDTFSDFVTFKREADLVDMNEETEKVYNNVASQGFMYPNSSVFNGIYVLLSKYLRAAHDRSREIWSQLASKLLATETASLDTAIDKASYNINYNKDLMQLDKKLADAALSYQGILNDLNIKRFSLTENDALQYRKHTHDINLAVYKAYVQKETTRFSAQAKAIMSKWDAESKRVEAAAQALEVNTAIVGAELQKEFQQINVQIKSFYDGLSKDISSWEESFSKNLSGLKTGFDQLTDVARAASKAVVSVTTGSGA